MTTMAPPPVPTTIRRPTSSLKPTTPRPGSASQNRNVASSSIAFRSAGSAENRSPSCGTPDGTRGVRVTHRRHDGMEELGLFRATIKKPSTALGVKRSDSTIGKSRHEDLLTSSQNTDTNGLNNYALNASQKRVASAGLRARGQFMRPNRSRSVPNKTETLRMHAGIDISSSLRSTSVSIPPPSPGSTSMRLHAAPAPSLTLTTDSSAKRIASSLKRKLAGDTLASTSSIILEDAIASHRSVSQTQGSATPSAAESTPVSSNRALHRKRSVGSSARATPRVSSMALKGSTRRSSNALGVSSSALDPSRTPLRSSARNDATLNSSVRPSTSLRSAIPLSSTRMIKKTSGTSSAGDEAQARPTSAATSASSVGISIALRAGRSTRPSLAASTSANTLERTPLSLNTSMRLTRSISGASTQRSVSGASSSATRSTRRPRDSWETVGVSSSGRPSLAPSGEAMVVKGSQASLVDPLLKLSLGPEESAAGDVSWEEHSTPASSHEVELSYKTPKKDGSGLLGLPSRAEMSYVSPDTNALRAAMREIATTPGDHPSSSTKAKELASHINPVLTHSRFNGDGGSTRRRNIPRGSATLDEILRMTMANSQKSTSNGNVQQDWLSDPSVSEAMRAEMDSLRTSHDHHSVPGFPDSSRMQILYEEAVARAQELEAVVAQQRDQLEVVREREDQQRQRVEKLLKDGDASVMRFEVLAKEVDELESELARDRAEHERELQIATRGLKSFDEAAATLRHRGLMNEGHLAVSSLQSAAAEFDGLANVARLQREDVGDQLKTLTLLKHGLAMMLLEIDVV